jgi:hypothetical protein
VNQVDATSQNLAFVTSQGTAIVKVDNTTNVPYNIKRNSVSSLEDLKLLRFYMEKLEGADHF